MKTPVTGIILSQDLRLTVVLAGHGYSVALKPAQARGLAAKLVELADQADPAPAPHAGRIRPEDLPGPRLAASIEEGD